MGLCSCVASLRDGCRGSSGITFFSHATQVSCGNLHPNTFTRKSTRGRSDGCKTRHGRSRASLRCMTRLGGQFSHKSTPFLMATPGILEFGHLISPLKPIIEPPSGRFHTVRYAYLTSTTHPKQTSMDKDKDYFLNGEAAITCDVSASCDFIISSCSLNSISTSLLACSSSLTASDLAMVLSSRRAARLSFVLPSSTVQ